MHSTTLHQYPISTPSTARPRTPSPFRCPIALSSYPPTPTHESNAPRRALCRAVPGSCPVAAVSTRRRCRDRPGWPSAPKRRDPGKVGPPSGWSPVARMSGRWLGRSLPCPRPRSHREDVRPTGRADVQCPGVRTDRPPVSAALPRCPGRAGPWSGSAWWAAPRSGAAGRRAAVVRGRRGRLPASDLTGSDGATLAVLGSHEGRP
jgi:hypothetical protein